MMRNSSFVEMLFGENSFCEGLRSVYMVSLILNGFHTETVIDSNGTKFMYCYEIPVNVICRQIQFTPCTGRITEQITTALKACVINRNIEIIP